MLAHVDILWVCQSNGNKTKGLVKLIKVTYMYI